MKKLLYTLLKRATSYLSIGILTQLLFVGLSMAHNGGPVPDLKETSLKYSRSPVFISVSGKVTSSSDGLGIPGVNILIKDTGIGAVTDADGNYAINTPNTDNILVFSSIGYASQEIALNGRTVIDVILEEDMEGLDEVVVIGYGTKKKINLTGAVASVTSEELERRTVTKASLALQGQMSGISVRQGSGNPGGNSASLLVRGQGTFSGAGNSPLVLVDGIESSIDNVNPNDIESVSVLKDAASAAIFGSKAANGVILIETKKGVVGEPVFSYNAYMGQSSHDSRNG